MLEKLIFAMSRSSYIWIPPHGSVMNLEMRMALDKIIDWHNFRRKHDESLMWRSNEHSTFNSFHWKSYVDWDFINGSFILGVHNRIVQWNLWVQIFRYHVHRHDMEMCTTICGINIQNAHDLKWCNDLQLNENQPTCSMEK